ncbi:MAG: type IX secretion system sortase PorU, partial [Flavobacteriales bacterium]|nr:type IX secretion system sortase PorU [Flavobacteriales bacterium]
YDDRAYYFVTADRGVAPRVAVQTSVGSAATHVVTSFVDHQFHEQDLSNLLGSGRLWMGELFDIESTHSADFGLSNVLNGSLAHINAQVFAKSMTSPTSFSMKVNGNVAGSVTVPSVSGGYNRNAAPGNFCIPIQLGSGNTNISLTYSKGGNPNAQGWLDYISVICARNLTMAGAQMAFRDTSSVGTGNVAEFQLGSASSAVRIWETTDPTNVRQMAAALNGSMASFKVNTDTLRQFIAFSGSSYHTVQPLGRVENQNLHGLAQADMVIVSHPDFITEANRLAEFHRNNPNNTLSVHVVTPQQIYNEFSSGAQDVSAIRDLMRMFYERSTSWQDMPRYLLLFGDASYDYKDRVSGNTNFVPSYQSEESLQPTTSFVSDDYFGLLDPHEGRWNPSDNDAMDIGIGRFPVDHLEEATAVVDKIIRYDELNIANTQNTDLCCGGAGQTTSPDWRNRITFVADDDDGNTHLNQADQLAVLVDSTYRDFNINKIYFDAYVQQSTPGGQRYPEATRDINNDVNRGVLIMNYTGHGGEVGWAHERVLGLSDIANWTNADNLVAFVTATCEFARHDDPERVSAGEQCLLRAEGGAIALFTTTRLVYSAPNFQLNRNFYVKLLDDQPWGEPSMGDVIRMTKVASGAGVNNRNFVLLGDPAQRLSYPLEEAVTATINGISVQDYGDTLKALQLVTVTGRMQTRSGQPMTDFNGIIYPTVFDKASVVSTLANDPGSSVRTFTLRNNILYKGKASVTNGEFRFQFVVPKDIAYNFGFGRISYYAEGMGINASGHFEDFVIGGSYAGAQDDPDGPSLRLFMNNESFVFGGTTDENPIMIALLTDSNGINTVGSGIGHDIAAIHNGNTAGTIVLNDYYEADLDSYQSGRVAYPFRDLPEGTHNLRFKAWDVHNNSAEAYTEFVVAESAELALQHVLNYPNPFTTRTQFMFEHNQACNSLDVMVQVFTVSGKIVKTIHQTVLTDGFRGDPIEWDGLDDHGQKIGRGVYVYNLKVTMPDGQKAEKIEKLVVLR